jgi:hypothetical protein
MILDGVDPKQQPGRAMMNDGRSRDTGQLALAVGVVAAGSAVCLATYFAVRGPFGTINDIGNAATGILSGLLAWRLRRQISAGSRAVVGSALVGAAITIVGSALVVSGTTGFFLAGLVSSVGFAGIGVWLVALNRSAFAVAAWPARLRALGVAAGALMALGFILAPGVLLRLDHMATAPGWVWVGSLGWLGIYVAYPAWAIWLGILETRRAERAIPASSAARS